jgi:ribosome-binding factor A
MAGRSRSSGRDYPRTARVNELLREIIAEELTEIDDHRAEHVSVTSVTVDRDLGRAVVYVDCLSAPGDEDEVLGALAEHRIRLQRAVGRQARLRRTPEVVFRADPAILAGDQIDGILRDLRAEGAMGPDDPEPAVDPEVDVDPEPDDAPAPEPEA